MNIAKVLHDSPSTDLSEILKRIDEGQVLIAFGGWPVFFEGQKFTITTAQKYEIRRLIRQGLLQFVWTGVKWTIQRAPAKEVQS